MKSILKSVSKIIPDRAYLKLKYRIKLNKKLNLDNPQTFNEKLQWIKLYDRKDIYTTMVDKYEAKKYVANIIGNDHIIPTIGVYDKFEDIDFEKLPSQFVLKCTHDSGGIVICKDKMQINKKIVKLKTKKSLKTNYYYLGREWPYKNVKPRIIAEEFIGENLIDYRFYCFNGIVEYIYMYINKANDINKPEPVKCNIYDKEWNLQNFHQKSLPSKEIYSKPKELKEMIEISETLAKDTKFLRVDLYIIKEKVFFGEMTFFPGEGFSKFYPSEMDYKLGKKLKIK